MERRGLVCAVGSVGRNRVTTSGGEIKKVRLQARVDTGDRSMERLPLTLDSQWAHERKPGLAWRRRQQMTLTGHRSCRLQSRA
jgi:hypothetical protein